MSTSEYVTHRQLIGYVVLAYAMWLAKLFIESWVDQGFGYYGWVGVCIFAPLILMAFAIAWWILKPTDNTRYSNGIKTEGK